MSQSVLRTAGALFIAAGCCLAAPSASADTWLFERIAQTGDALPSTPGSAITNLSAAWIHNGNVVYFGDADIGAEQGVDFIAGRINGIRRTIATTLTPVPEGIGVFDQLSMGEIENDMVVFAGHDSSRGDPNSGIYKYRPASKLHKIIDLSDNVAGLPASSFTALEGARIEGSEVFYAGDYSPQIARGVFRALNGSHTLIFSEDSSLPGGGTIDSVNTYDRSNGALAVGLDTTNSGLTDSIYRYTQSDSERLVRLGDLVDNGQVGETFNSIGQWNLDPSGETVVFTGFGDMGSAGFYGASGGIPWKILDRSDFAPPAFTDTFNSFQTSDSDNGSLAFSAITTADLDNRIYYMLNYDLGSEPKLVIQPGDTLDGKTVMHVGFVSTQGVSNHTLVMRIEFDDASEGIYTARLLQESFETEPNNGPETANCIEILSDCAYISGKLQHNEYPECDPDTVLAAFDKDLNFLVDMSGMKLINDDDATEGDGRGSALWDIPLVFNNGVSGAATLRLGVTGAGDIVEGQGGSNGDFNGLLQNAPHGQMGEFTLTVTFVDSLGDPLPSPAMLPDGSLIENPIQYVEEFRTGGEAFYFNYVAPIGADAAHAVVDNTTGRVDVCNDVDFYEFKNLIPACPYCIIQVGGVTKDCEQTDGLLVWYDKDGNIILTDDNSGFGLYASLCNPDLPVVADINGVIRIAFTGSGDNNFNGLRDGAAEDDYLANNPLYSDDYPGLPPSPAPSMSGGQQLGRAVELVCADPIPDHGVCGCYTLKIMLDTIAHGDGSQNDPEPIVNAMSHGDINMDGVTDTADLGILVGNFGWTVP